MDHDPVNAHAVLLGHWLDAMEDVIRGDVAALAKQRGTLFRGEPKQLRILDLTDALEALPRARAALAQCPAGAALAHCVLGIALARLRTAAESADLHYRGALKGLPGAKSTRAKRTARRHATIRRKAAKLKAKSASAKAAILARTSTVSARTIRRILQK